MLSRSPLPSPAVVWYPIGKVNEPVVRIQTKSPEELARCRDILTRAGYAIEESGPTRLPTVGAPTPVWILVRDAHPDAVNEELVKGGAFARVAAREQIARLLAYLIDRQGQLADRAMNLRNLAGRVLEEAGLADRYALKADAELVQGSLELYERLMATGAGFVKWEEFLSLFTARKAS